ncbi:hypothetical protein WJX79_008096 [Trebouxia sp. C0005]
MGGSNSKDNSAADCPVVGQGETSSCPIPEDQRGIAVYNVYNQRIDSGNAASTSSFQGDVDPRNNMPREANQQPCAGQRQLISTSRLVSNIPKGGTQGTWVYPSPQMFYNSLKRKGKGSDVEEADMEAVVHAHNTMNELTWRRVLEWEALHHDTCGNPKLLRFMGKPHDLSPMARLMGWNGGPMPFDRHDWFVDRCGEEVRYVIDFYFDDDKAGTPEAFTLRVRPAVDTPTAALDRVKMNIYTTFAKYGLPCPITGHASGQYKQPNAEVRTNS